MTHIPEDRPNKKRPAEPPLVQSIPRLKSVKESISDALLTGRLRVNQYMENQFWPSR